MNSNLTELVFILDRSGSMYGMEADTIGGFNSVIAKQREEKGAALVSTVLFSHETQLLHDRIDLDKVPEMTEKDFRVGGNTALLDALGGSIHHIGMVHKYAREEDIPAHTIFIIMTDGMENASRHYSSEKVKQMIEHEKSKYGWEFIYLAANIDAVESGAHIGIDPMHSRNFHNDKPGARVCYDAIDKAVHCIRTKGSLDVSWSEDVDKDFTSR